MKLYGSAELTYFYNSALYSFSIYSPVKTTWPFFHLNINTHYKLQFFLFHLEIFLHTLSTLYLIFSLHFSHETATSPGDYIWVCVYTLMSCTTEWHFELPDKSRPCVQCINDFYNILYKNEMEVHNNLIQLFSSGAIFQTCGH